jgi:HlyD family secretion protein
MRSRLGMFGLMTASLLIAGCGARATEAPTPQATDEYSSVVPLTGEVVPAVYATLSAQTGGTVVELLVQPGEDVSAGDALVRLDAADEQLAVQLAEAALDMARADLGLLIAGPRSQEIAIAEAQLSAAQAGVSQAVAARDQLTAGVPEAEIAAARASVAEAMAVEKAARDAYDQLRDAGVHGWVEEQTILRLRAAEEARAAAEAALAQSEGGAGAQVLAAEAAVWAAAAQRDVAQAQLDLLIAGATAEAMVAAEARVSQAEASLDSAFLALSRCQIPAPFDGTVGVVFVREGELVAPGQPIASLGDLGTLQVEITDLNDIDVARVQTGQRATLSFDALPDREFTGTVSRVSPMPEPTAGAIRYEAIVELDEIDPALRWGMVTAFLDIEVAD